MAKRPPNESEATFEQPPKLPIYQVAGSLGLRQTGGYVWEDFEPSLRGYRAVEVWERMSQDATCGAILWAIESVLRGVTWEVEPARDPEAPKDAQVSDEAVEAAEFVRAVLFDDMVTPWPQLIAEALSVLPFGYSLHEVIWEKRDDGRVGIRDVAPRPQDTVLRWTFDDEGAVNGVVQRHPISGREVMLPSSKLLHFIVRSRKRSPEGVSIFRTAYKAWTYATNLANIEAIGLERDLAGLPIARVPMALMTEAASGDAGAIARINEYARMVRDLRRNEQAGVILPSDPHPSPDGSGVTALRQYDFELMASRGASAGAADTAIRRYKAEIATSVLADFILLGQGATGSWALSTDKTELFLQSLKAVLDAIAAECQRGLVVRLWALNGFPPETRPRLRPGPIAPEDMGKLAETLAALAGAGARLFPDDAVENRLRERLGLPPLAANGAADDPFGGPGGGADMGGPPGAEPDPFAELLGTPPAEDGQPE